MIIFARFVPAALIPTRSLNWDIKMSMATADVNPELTGPEMKSIKKPKNLKIFIFSNSKMSAFGNKGVD